MYDPRREERRKQARVALPEGIDPRMLDADVRRELRSLSKETADLVAQHLIVTGQLLDQDPDRALTHARAAVALAGRVGVVREAAGLAAYAAGEWSDALSELRAARRMTGSPEHLAVMADCERALGRQDRALKYADDREVAQLTNAQRVELVIVVSGARRDLRQYDAAVLVLKDPAQRTTGARPWASRLWYAYADALLEAGREDDAREWFQKAADVDEAGETDAQERLMALDGIVFEDAYDGDDDEGPDAWITPDAEDVMAGFAAAMTASQGAEPTAVGGGPAPAEALEVHGEDSDDPAGSEADTSAGEASGSGQDAREDTADAADAGDDEVTDPDDAADGSSSGDSAQDEAAPARERASGVPAAVFTHVEPAPRTSGEPGGSTTLF
ncbi:MAG: hypothetical protein Q8R60_09925 [Mycobacteriales bacterium]|nr:hypothetical protein [Mycobacteriales bacterium]